MLSVRLDSPVPIGDQILAGIRRLIASGQLCPGNELPPVRQLAADLGVNLNTVARAYRALEGDGLVTTVRGRGTQVLADRQSPRPSEQVIRGRITEAMRNTLADARLAGMERHDAEALIQQVADEFWPQRDGASSANNDVDAAKED